MTLSWMEMRVYQQTRMHTAEERPIASSAQQAAPNQSASKLSKLAHSQYITEFMELYI